MDFPDLGAHCQAADCHQLDFLPFTCDMCQNTFCLEHHRYEDHRCHAWEAFNKESHVPRCPLCNIRVPRKSHESSNDAVEKHISAGCPPPTSEEKHIVIGNASKKTKKDTSFLKKKKICTVPKCNFKAEVECRECRTDFCLTHRNENDHSCAGRNKQKVMFKKDENSRQALRDILSKRSTSERQSRVLRKASDIQQSENDNQNIDADLFFVNTGRRGDTLGQSSIEPQDRVILAVFFPTETRLQPVFMHVNRRWTVGKVIDRVATHAGIRNRNNTPDVDVHLHLIPLGGTASGDGLLHLNQSLPPHTTMQSLLERGLLGEGRNGVVLERARRVKAGIRTAGMERLLSQHQKKTGISVPQKMRSGRQAKEQRNSAAVVSSTVSSTYCS